MIKNVIRFECPCLDNRKSFYGKAIIEKWEFDQGNPIQCLISYSTQVCKINHKGEFIKLWNGYSNTTMRHINSFRLMNGMDKISKSEWDNMTIGG